MSRTYFLAWNERQCAPAPETARARGKRAGGLLLRHLVLALALAFPASALALPNGEQISAGSGDIGRSGSTLTVTQTSPRLAINWQGFNIGQNESVNFNQPGSSAIALNRVLGQDPSQILGSLSANGQVFVLNPNGVLFGRTAQVNVGGLVASSLNMSNADLMAGNYTFSNSGTAGSVLNQGSLTAANGGYIALLAPEVRNEGVIIATLGTALLAAGDKIALGLNNGSLLSYTIDQGALNALAENKQLIRADGGQVILSAKAANALTSSVVNNSGIIEARTIQNQGGVIKLLGDAGRVSVGGALDASGRKTGETGGTVKVLGDRVGLLDGARIDVSGDAGGGTALVGGNYQGKGTEQNASATFVAPGAQINADALTNGDGGKVIAWADGTTRAFGSISARGGVRGGDGGFVEVSGKRSLVFAANVDRLAPNGNVGTLLLDPTNLTIVSDSASVNVTPASPFEPATASGSTLGWSEINSALSGGAVSVQTTTGFDAGEAGNITIAGAGTLTNGNTLSIIAAGNITQNAGSTITRNAAGALNLTAASGSVTLNDNVTLNGSALTVTAGSFLQAAGTINAGGLATINVTGASSQAAGAVIAGSGGLTKTGTGTLALSGNNTYTGVTTVSAGVLNLQNATATGTTAGGVTVASGAALELQGGIAVGAEALSITGTGVGGTGVLLNVSGDNTWGGTVTQTGNATIGSSSGLLTLNAANAVTGAFDLTFAGAGSGLISGTITTGANPLTKTGAGTLTLSGANLYTGLTTVSAGTLRYGGDNALASGAVTVNDGGTYDLNGFSDSIGALTVNSGVTGGTVTTGAGTLTLGGNVTSTGGATNASISGNLALGAATRTFTTTNAADGMTVSATVSGAAGLTKAGTGTLTLSGAGANTYTGTTTVGIAGTANSGGTLLLNKSAGAIAVPGALSVIGDGTVRLLADNQIVSNSAWSVGTSSGAPDTAGTVDLNNFSNAVGSISFDGLAGTVQTGAGTLTLGGDISATSTLTGNATFTGNLSLGTATRTITNNDTVSLVTVNAAITGEAGTGLTKAGAGQLQLGGANTYTGATTINAGTLSIGADTGLGAAPGAPTAGQITFGGGTLATTSSFTLDANRGIALTGAGTISTASGSTLTYEGVIAGASTLTKAGTGTLTLSGANTYTGATTVSAGTLSINSIANVGGGASAMGAPTTVAGGTIAIGATTVAGTLVYTGSGHTTDRVINLAGTSGGATLDASGSGALVFTSAFTATGAGDKTFTLTGSSTGANTLSGAIVNNSGTNITAVTKAGTGTWTLSGASTYTGLTTVSAGVLNLQNNTATGTTAGGVSVASGAALELQGSIVVGAEALSITGTGVGGAGALRNVGGTNTWGGAITLGAGGARINSDSDTLTLSGAIGGNTQPLTVGGAGNTTISGVIGTTTGTLTKDGIGMLTLSGANTYTGATAINEGTLQLGAANRIADMNAVTVTSGATFDLNGFSETVGSIAGAGTLTSGAAGAVTLTAGGNNTSTTFSGIIADGSGTVALTKAGTGTLTLSGTNTYTGKTTLNAGTLSIGADSGLGAAPCAPAAGQLTFGGGILATTSSFTLDANRGIALTGAGTISTDPGTTLAYGGTIAGASTLAKTGTGTLALSGANTYTGVTTASAGVVRVQNNAALGDTAGGTTVASGAALELQGGIAVGAEALSITGTGVGGTGVLLNVSGDNTWGGTVTQTGNATIGSSSGLLTLNAANAVTGAFDLTFAGAGSGLIGGTITTGANPLTKTGAGTLALAGANTYTGVTTVSAGVLRVQNNTATGTTAGGVTVASGAALELQGGIGVGTEALTLNSDGVGGTGALRNVSDANAWGGAITLGAGGARINSDSGTLTLSGAIGGATRPLTVGGEGNTTISGVIGTTSGTLTKDGTGTLTLSGTNTYTGLTTISAGTLKLLGGAAIANTGAISLLNAAGVTLDLNGTNETIGSLAGGGTTGGIVTNGAAGGSTLTTGDATSTTFSGVIQDGSGTVALTKAGTGTLALSGNNTYTGATTASAGVVRVQNNTALGDTAGGTTVASGAAIEIDGSGLLIAEPITSLIGTGISSGGALRNLANANTWSGAITLGAGGARINSDSGTLTLSGAIGGNTLPTTVGGAGNTTISGAIGTTTGTLTKDGAGTLTLGGTNTYMGLTTVSAGTLKFLGGAAIADTAAVSLANAAGVTLDLNGTNETIGSLAGGGATGGIVTNGAAGVSTLTTGDATSTTFTGVIQDGSGTVALTKQGSGVFTLAGANTYTSGLRINAGTVLGTTSASAFGAGTITLGDTSGTADAILKGGLAGTFTNPITVASGSSGNTLSISNSAASIFSGAVTLNNNLTLAPTLTNLLTLSGGMTGTGNLIVSGSGTTAAVTLSTNPINHSGTITNQGTNTGTTTISADVGANVTAITESSTTSALTLSGLITPSSGGTTLTNALGTKLLTVSGGVSGTGDLVLNNNSALANGITLSTGAVNNTGTITNSGSGSGSTLISAIIGSNVTGVVQNSSTSGLTLSGANTYTSGLRINAGTVLGTTSASAFGAGTITLGDTSGTADAILKGGLAGTFANPITVASGSSGNTLSISNSAASIFSGAVTLNNNLTLAPTLTNLLTLSGGITGTGNLIVNGSGTSAAVTLSTNPINHSGTITNQGTNTGTTTISADVGANVTAITESSTTSALTLSGLITPSSGGTTLTNALGTKLLTVSGGVSGTGDLVLNNNSALANGITLSTGAVNNTGTITNSGSGSGSTLISAIIGSNVTGVVQNSSTSGLTLSGANTYTGTTTVSAGTLALGASNVLADASSVVVNGGTLTMTTFNDTVAGVQLASGSITGTTGVLTSTSDFDLQSGTASAILGGAAGLNKSAGGTLILSGANTYTGATAINEGTLQLGAANRIADTNAVTVASGGTFDLNGFSDTIGSIAGAGTLSSGAAGAVTLTAGGNNTSTTFSGTIADGSGTVALTKAGTGTLALSGDNTYTGKTIINAGTLSIGADSGLGAAPGAPAAGQLTFGGGILATTGSFTLDANRGISLTGAGTISTDPGTTLAYGGTIAGASTLAKTGTGTLALSGANTYTGATTVSAGVLNLQNNTATGTTAGGVSVASGAALELQGGIGVGAEALSITGTGVGGAGALRNVGGTNTWGGAITLGAGGARINSDSDTLTLSGAIGGNTQPLTVGGAGNTTISGVIGTTTGTLTKDGIGTLTLSGANTYTGATAIYEGTLQLGAANRIADTNAVTVASGGTFDLNGFSDTIGSIAGAGTLTSGAAGAVTLTAGGNNTSTTFSGIIADGSGTVALTKAGTGTLTLSGDNTYTGATTVSAGVVRVQNNTALGDTAGGTTVASGAALELQGGIAVGAEALSITGTGVGGTGVLLNASGDNTWGGTVTQTGNATIGSSSGLLTLNAANAVTGAFDLTFAGAGGGLIGGTITTGANTLTKTGAGTLALSGDNTYTGVTTVSAGVLRVQNNTALGTTAGGTTVASGAAIEVDGSGLVIAEPVTSMIGTGISSGGALRNLANANTWSGVITLGAGGARINSDSGALTLSGTIGGNTRPLTVGGAGNTTISGVIGTTTGTLTKDGAGTLTLSNANTYTGVTTISAGTLALGATDAVDSSSAVTVAGGATFDLNGFSDTIGSIAGAGTLTSGAAGAVTLTAGGNNTSTTFSGTIADGSGTVALTKAGTGTLTLSGTNTYTGKTTINAGTLSIGADSGLGAAPAAPAAGQLTFGGGILATTSSFTLDANRGIALTGAGTISTDPGTTLAYGGTIAGASTLAKTGTGTLALSGDNTYTGATTVSAGVVRVQNNAALGDTAGGTTVASGAAIEIDGSGLLIAEPVTSLIGTGISSGGALRNLANANTWSGAITLGAGGARIYSDSGTLTLSGAIGGNTRPLTVGGEGNITISSVIGTTSGTLTKDGAGTLNLSAANTYTGVTTVSEGVLRVQNNTATGTTAGGVSVASGAALELQGGIGVGAEALSITGTGVGGTGALRNVGDTNAWGGAITLGTGGARINSDSGTLTLSGAIGGNTRPLTVGGAGNTTISGVIGTTTGTLTKDGIGTLTLSGANTYTGATAINEGTLQLGAANRIADTNAVTVTSGATFDLNGFSETVGSIAGAGNVSLGAATLTAGGDNSSTTFSGVISGTGGLTKSGSGSLTLSGANTYTGLAMVSAGTLSAQNAAGLGTAATGATVAAGATLDINGVAIGAEAITLNGNGAGGAGALTGTGTAALGGQVTLATDSRIGATAGNTLAINGAIEGSGALDIAGAGTVTLGGAVGGTTALASLSSGATTSLAINGGFARTTGAQTYNGATTFGGATTLRTTAGGNVSAPGAVTATAGTLTLDTGAGDATLTNTGNDFSTVAVTSGKNVSIVDATALAVAGINATALVDVRTQSGDLTLNNAIATASTSANAVTLIADAAATPNATGSGGNFKNAGAAAIATGAGGAWRIYTGNPTGTTRGGLAEAGKRYNVDDGSDPLASGNRIYFRIQPTLTLTADNKTKVYGDANPAFTSSYSGLIDSDLIGAAISSGPSYIVDGSTSTSGHLTAGIHNIIPSATATSLGYSLDYANGALTVGQKVLTVTAAGVAKVYDGNTAAAVTYGDNRLAGDVLTIAGIASYLDKNVGTGKTVNVSGIALSDSDAGNYSFNTTASTTADITPRALTITAAGVAKVYDGGTTATVAYGDNRVAGDALTIAGTASYLDKNVGTGKTVNVSGIALTNTDAGNYTFNTTASTTADIIAAHLAVTGVTVSNKVYDGTTAAILGGTAAISAFGGDAVTLGGSGSAVFADKNVAPGKAVTVSGYSIGGADAGNYTLMQPTGLTANITARPLTVTAAGVAKVYDGSTAATVTYGDNRLAGDVLTIAGIASYLDKNVGTGKTVNVSGIALSDSDAGNYSFNTTASTTADITPRALTITAAGVAKVYDGGTTATVAYGDNRVAGDALTIAGTASYLDKNVGTGKTVNVSGIALTNTDAGNYTFNTTASTTADITPRALTVAANDATKTYTGVAYSGGNGVTYTGFANGETSAVLDGTLAYGGTSQGAIDPGSYLISPSGLTSGNYIFTYKDGVLTVNPAPAAGGMPPAVAEALVALPGGASLLPAFNAARAVALAPVIPAVVPSGMMARLQPIATRTSARPADSKAATDKGGKVSAQPQAAGVSVTNNGTVEQVGSLTLVNGGVKLPARTKSPEGGKNNSDSDKNSE